MPCVSLNGDVLCVCKVDLMPIVPLMYCSDFSGVSKAYEAMKNVASLINERKRRLESVDTIAHWQVAIQNWEVRIKLAYMFCQLFLPSFMFKAPSDWNNISGLL